MLGHGFQPVFRFNSTINNSSQIAATTPVRIANPICSNDASVHPQVRTKSLRKVSKETTESAIRDIQDSSDLESALLRCLFLIVSVFFLKKPFLGN